MDELVLGPAERTEILIDFSEFKKSNTVELLHGDSAFMNFIVQDAAEADEDFAVPSELTTVEKMI